MSVGIPPALSRLPPLPIARLTLGYRPTAA